MLQTLVHIPHELFGLKVFGIGLLLAVWAVVACLILACVIWNHGWSVETLNYLQALGILGLAIVLLSFLEEIDVAGRPVGLPIRGYGVMLLIAVVSGVWLSTYRAKRMGVDPEHILSLAFWMFVAGIVGARFFFVIEFWHQFRRESLVETLLAVVKVTEGGLVVYGSLIGAMFAALAYLTRQRLPILAMADLIAPSLVLGLAFGRIGCLFNGCCFGNTCQQPWAITFPQTSSSLVGAPFSPPYEFQKRSGQLYGLQFVENPDGRPRIAWIDSHSSSAQLGLEPGVPIKSINGQPVENIDEAHDLTFAAKDRFTVTTADGKKWDFSVPVLPNRTRPIHPTQIYSSINAILICLFLLAFYPYRRRDGEVIAICLTIYPVARILLEIIRADETIALELTISQIVSVMLLLMIVPFWIYVLKQPRGSSLPFCTSFRPDLQPSTLG